MLQFVLAVLIWVLGPAYALDEDMRRWKIPPYPLPPELISVYRPPKAERALYALDFPATIFAVQTFSLVRGYSTPEWEIWLPNFREFGPRKVLYGIGVREVAFFGGVVLLWYWVGRKLDALLARRRGGIAPTRRLRSLTELVFLLALTIDLFGTSFVCLTTKDWVPPEKQIAAFGLVWPIAFSVYLFYAFRQELRRRRAQGT